MSDVHEEGVRLDPLSCSTRQSASFRLASGSEILAAVVRHAPSMEPMGLLTPKRYSSRLSSLGS